MFLTDFAKHLSGTSILHFLLQNYKDNPLALTSLTAELSENLENSTDEQIDLMVGIVEFIADPATPKELVKEGEFFFDIVNNMMEVPLDGMKSGSKKDTEKNRERRSTDSEEEKAHSFTSAERQVEMVHSAVCCKFWVNNLLLE